MKRGTSEHPKVRRFARALGVGLAQAVGHLELLWHFTAKFAPAGDLGRFHDADIEEACAWEGESGKMVAALTESGWLDSHAQHRVIVHDWSEHADDATNLTLARAGRLFADGKRPKTTRLLQAERTAVEAKLTEAESVRTASARNTHAKRKNAHGVSSPSHPLPSPPIPSSKSAADAAPHAPDDPLDPEKLVNLLGSEPGEREAKLAWLKRELPVIQAKAFEDHPKVPDRRMAGVCSRVLTHFRQHHKAATAPPSAIKPRGSILPDSDELARLSRLNWLPMPTLDYWREWVAAGKPERPRWWIQEAQA